MRIPLSLFLTTAVLFACSEDGSPGSSTPNSDILIVQDADTKGTNAYSPNPFTISLADGGEVQWGNNDRGSGYGSSGTTHTVVADDESFNSGNIAPGATFTHTFVGAGTVAYHCSIHPTMQGTIQINP
jgi:plastocyanin